MPKLSRLATSVGELAPADAAQARALANGRGASVRSASAPVVPTSGIGEWDGDGARDPLAVSRTGSARVYRGNGTGGFSGSIALTGDWSSRETVVGVGDVSWDNKVDVLSINAAGEAEFGLRGSTLSEVRWSTTQTSFADVDVDTG